MQTFGYILGGLLITACVAYMVFSVIKIVRDLRERRAAKKGKSDTDELKQESSNVNNEEVDSI